MYRVMPFVCMDSDISVGILPIAVKENLCNLLGMLLCPFEIFILSNNAWSWTCKLQEVVKCSKVLHICGDKGHLYNVNI